MKVRSAVLLMVMGLLALGGVPGAFGQTPVAAGVNAAAYSQWASQTQTATTAASGQVMTLAPCYFPVQGSSSSFFPFAGGTLTPVTVTDPASTSETVVPTAVTTPVQASGSSAPGGFSCTITATFSFAHAAGVKVTTGDGGILEAATAIQKGMILLPPGWASDTAIGALAGVDARVSLIDDSGSTPVYWQVQPSTLTALATPATRSASAGATQVISGTATGTWSATTYFVCVTYVDQLGGESPCSASFSFSATASVALNYASPAASTGAVGWRAYAGITNTSLQYQLPISSTTCTLSVRTPYPTCAIGSAGVFPTPSTTTALAPAAGGVAATYRPNTQSHTTFAYQPTSQPVPAGFQRNYGPFLISPALTAGQAVVVGTVPLPAGYLNYIGKTIRISGRLTVTPSTGGTDQIIVGIGDTTDFTTGTPKSVCTQTETTAITTAAQTQYFTCIWTVNATGATGTIMPSGFNILQVGAGTTAGAAAVESATAAITADVLNQSTINIEFLQTSAAETTTPPQLMDLHIEEM